MKFFKTFQVKYFIVHNCTPFTETHRMRYDDSFVDYRIDDSTKLKVTLTGRNKSGISFAYWTNNLTNKNFSNVHVMPAAA